MADSTISGLAAASAVVAANELEINEAGVSKKVSAAQLRTFINPDAAWEGNIAGAYGDGNPNALMLMVMKGGNPVSTPTNITTTVARLSYFRLRTALVVNKVRYFGAGVTADIYRIAIYNGDTLARVLTETAFTTALDAWGEIGSSLNLTLNAGQLYFLAVAVNATGTTGGVVNFVTAPTATAGIMGVLPKSFPGNLDVDGGYMAGGIAQGAVTAGALPDPFPTVAANSGWTNGMPAFWLDNSNA